MKNSRLLLLAAMIPLMLVSCKEEETGYFNYGFRNQIKPLLKELKKDKDLSLFAWNLERISRNAIDDVDGFTVFAMQNDVLTRSDGNRDTLAFAQLYRHIVKDIYSEAELLENPSLTTIADLTLGLYDHEGGLYVNNVLVREVREYDDFTICIVGKKFDYLEGKVVDRMTDISYRAGAGADPSIVWRLVYREDGVLNEVVKYNGQGIIQERHWLVLNSAGVPREYKYVPAGSEPSSVTATIALTHTSGLLSNISDKSTGLSYDFRRDSDDRVVAWNEYNGGAASRSYEYSYGSDGNVSAFGEKSGNGTTPSFVFDTGTKNILNTLQEEWSMLLMTVLSGSGFPLTHPEFHWATNNLTESVFNDATADVYIKNDYRVTAGDYPSYVVSARSEGASPTLPAYPEGWYPEYRKYTR